MTTPAIARKAAEVVVIHFGGRVEDVLSSTRGSPDDALRRAYAVWLVHRTRLRQRYNTSIGRAFGRDRTTIRHAITRVEGFLETDPSLGRKLERAEEDFRRRL